MCLAVAGLALSFMGTMQQASAMKQQARVAEIQADQAHNAGAFKQGQFLRQAQRVGGQQRAANAEGGMGNEGSFTDVQEDTATEMDMDLQVIQSNTAMNVWAKKMEAKTMRSRAQSTVLSGFGNLVTDAIKLNPASFGAA